MLNSDDRAILEFERGWWLEPGPKDPSIEFTLGLSATDYYERLRTLVFERSALAYDPLTVKRVRSLIEVMSDRELAV